MNGNINWIKDEQISINEENYEYWIKKYTYFFIKEVRNLSLIKRMKLRFLKNRKIIKLFKVISKKSEEKVIIIKI